MVYDSDSLVADVGGYMGLLLGESLYGIFHMISQWMVALIARRKKITKVVPIKRTTTMARGSRVEESERKIAEK